MSQTHVPTDCAIFLVIAGTNLGAHITHLAKKWL